MEALKPLIVLALFGTILYGAYAVVQKGPAPSLESTAADATTADGAPAFNPPQVQLPAPPAAVADSQPAVTPPSTPSAAPAFASPALPSEGSPGASPVAPGATTYLSAESAAPPVPDQVPTTPAALPVPPTSGGMESRPDRYAALTPPPLSAKPAVLPPATPQQSPLTAAGTPSSGTPSAAMPPAADTARTSSSAFATAWADAHDKLAAGRYAEALAVLSAWYDDPALGLEESQRLEDLLGQLAGTVIYSQEHMLLPPHIVATGETLPAIAAPLGVSWQLLAKINGVDDPTRLIAGEHLKLVRGPFDAVVSISRRRLSIQLNGNYAGSFPVVVGRQFLDRVGGSLPVATVHRGMEAAAAGGVSTAAMPAGLRRSIVLSDGLTIEAVDDPAAVIEHAPQSSLVVSARDLAELIDILGPGSRVLVRQ